MSTTLKDGDTVIHPQHGDGIVYTKGAGNLCVMHRSPLGHLSFSGLTGWTRTHTCSEDAAAILESYERAKTTGWHISNGDMVILPDGDYRAIKGVYDLWKTGKLVTHTPGMPTPTVPPAAPKPTEKPKQVRDVQGDVWDLNDDGTYDCIGESEFNQPYEYVASHYGPLAPIDEPMPAAVGDTKRVSMRCDICGEDVTADVRLDAPDGDGVELRNLCLAGVTTHRHWPATPPAPTEPTGLGAVITATCTGARIVRPVMWVHVGNGRWAHVDPSGAIVFASWAELGNITIAEAATA